MTISSFCLQQRQQEQQERTKLIALGLVGSAVLHGVVASALVVLYQRPKIVEDPIELIIVDRPEPEVPQPKEEIKKTPPPKPVALPTPQPLIKKVLEPPKPAQLKPKPAPTPKAIAPKPAPAPTPKAIAPKPAPAPTPKEIAPKPAPAPTPQNSPVKTTEPLPITRSSPRQPIRETQPLLTSPTQPKPNSFTAPSRSGTVATQPSTPLSGTSQPIQSSSGSEQLRKGFTGGNSAASTGIGNEGNSAPGTVAATQSSAPPKPQPSGGGGISCISRCQPSYPSVLGGVEGSAIVRVAVDPNGNVTGVTLAGAHGNSQINRQALLAAREMQFSSPGTGGQASVEIKVSFTVAGSEFDRLAREREEQVKREREARERERKEREARLERERQQRQAQLEAERQEREREQKAKEAQLQLETQQRQIQLEAERQEKEQKEREAQLQRELQQQELEKKIEPATPAPAELSPLIPEE